MSTKLYLILNFTIARAILAIFIFTGLSTPDINHYNKNCSHKELLGAPCPTCGLTEGLSSIIKGQPKEARYFQQNSPAVFIFLTIQLLLRATVIILLLKSKIFSNVISGADIIVSLVLFVWTFKNIVPQSIYIFYKMLLTGNIS